MALVRQFQNSHNYASAPCINMLTSLILNAFTGYSLDFVVGAEHAENSSKAPLPRGFYASQRSVHVQYQAAVPAFERGPEPDLGSDPCLDRGAPAGFSPFTGSDGRARVDHLAPLLVLFCRSRCARPRVRNSRPVSTQGSHRCGMDHRRAYGLAGSAGCKHCNRLHCPALAQGASLASHHLHLANRTTQIVAMETDHCGGFGMQSIAFAEKSHSPHAKLSHSHVNTRV